MSVYATIKVLLFGVILFLNSGTSIAQIDLNVLLAGANRDDALKLYQAQIDFLGEEKLSSPWIHRVEFRTRTNDFNLSQEDFRFRIAPTNPAEIRANKDYFRAQQELTDTRYQLALNEALVDRYETFVTWVYLWNYKASVEQEILIVEDILLIYRSSVNSLQFDYEDYLEKEKDKTLLELKLRNIDHEIENEKFRIREVFKYSGNINPETEMISIQSIRNIMEENAIISDSSHLKLLETEQELALANIDYKVDKAKNRRNIGYIQAEFDSERGDIFEEHMGFQVGIRLPITNPDRPDDKRTRLDLIDDQFDSQLEGQWLKIKRAQAEANMNYLMETQRFLHSKIEVFNESIQQTQSFSDNPMVLLKNMENKNQLQLKLIEIESEIYFTYLNLLDLFGVLPQLPLRNYLSEGLNVVEQQ